MPAPRAIAADRRDLARRSARGFQKPCKYPNGKGIGWENRRLRPFLRCRKVTMNLEALADLQLTLVEISASAAVMQSEIRALMNTHPNPAGLRAAFLEEIERHTARSLALAVPDELCERIQALAQRALKEMPQAVSADRGLAPDVLAST